MAKITRDVIESYLACHYKAFLKLTEHSVVSLDNPKPLLGGDSQLSPARGKVNHHQQGMRRAVGSINLTSSSLSKGDPLILDGVFETDLISLHIDGLQRVAGSSGTGNFHYLPCVIPSSANAGDTQKGLLDVVAFILSRLQRRVPDKGIIWRGEEKSSVVQLSPDLKRGERILNALTEMPPVSDKLPPK
jgi:hypothetical protein